MRILVMVADGLLSVLLKVIVVTALALVIHHALDGLPMPVANAVVFLGTVVLTAVALALRERSWRALFSQDMVGRWITFLALLTALLAFSLEIRPWSDHTAAIGPTDYFILFALLLIDMQLRLPFPFFGWGRKRDLLSLVKAGDVRRLREALAAHPEAVNTPSRSGETPLLASLRYTPFNTATMALLLEQGADPDMADAGGITPLLLAIMSNRVDHARLLLDHGASLKAVTPLHIAALAKRPKMAQLFLEHGADVNAISGEGVTPLHLSALRGDFKTTQLLLNHGADINARTDTGETPLDYTVKSRGLFLSVVTRGRHRVADFLRQRGAVSGA